MNRVSKSKGRRRKVHTEKENLEEGLGSNKLYQVYQTPFTLLCVTPRPFWLVFKRRGKPLTINWLAGVISLSLVNRNEPTFYLSRCIERKQKEKAFNLFCVCRPNVSNSTGVLITVIDQQSIARERLWPSHSLYIVSFYSFDCFNNHLLTTLSSPQE